MTDIKVTHLQKLRSLLEPFKAQPEKFLAPFILQGSPIFPILSHEERDEFADEFFNWTKENEKHNPANLGFGYYILAIKDFFKENFGPTLQNFFLAVKIFEENNEKDAAAAVYSVIGSAYRSLGDYNTALNYLWQGREQLDKTNTFLFSNIVACHNISQVFLELKEYEKALEQAREVVDKATKNNILLWITNGTNVMGLAYTGMQNYEEGKKYLLKSLELSKDLGVMYQAKVHHDLGNLYSKMEKFDDAKMHYETSANLLNDSNYMGVEINNYINLGSMYMKLRNYDKAIHNLNIGLAKAEKLNIKPRIYHCHQLISEIYEKKGNLEKSLSHYKNYKAIHDEVEKEDAKKKINNLQTIFQAEQTKKENIIIKQQRDEIQKKNIELQETIDELTRTKVSRRAKAITLVVALVLIVTEDFLVDLTINNLPLKEFWFSFAAKLLIIFSLKPIENLIEHFLLEKLVKKRRMLGEGL